MVTDIITANAKNKIIQFLGGSSFIYPNYFIIGTGSATITSGDTTLNTAFDRQLVTSTTYTSSSGISWQGDWNSAEVSGATLTEWGMIPSGTGLTGSIWSHHIIAGVIFDGTNELRLIENWVMT